jgi:hypothetical protein
MAPQFDPSLSFRGFQPNTPPLLGSSNMSNALAGKYANALQLGNVFPAPTTGTGTAPVATPQNVPGVSPDLITKYGGIDSWNKMGDQSKAAIINQQGNLDLIGRFMDPGYQKQQQDAALAFYRAQGDQQMRYRMQNDIVANLGQAAKAAFSRYSDPTPIANMIANSGAAYAEGARGASNLAQLGAGQPAVKYFSV